MIQLDAKSFGESIQMIGDVNGDGFDALLVGPKVEEGDNGVGGASFIYFGRSNGLVQRMAWVVAPGAVPIGDVNGDGFDDLAVPVPDWTMVKVFYGSPSGPKLSPEWTVTTEQAGSFFGHDIACAGGVNGDGFDDVLIGAMKFNGRYEAGGKAYLYYGSSHGLSHTNFWSAEYDLPVRKGIDDIHEQFFSCGLSSAGDVNADGFDDVVIGESVRCAGDINSDGYPDVLLVGPGYQEYRSDKAVEFGRLVVCYGGPNGLPFTHEWTPKKPLLLSIQQTLEQYHRKLGTAVYWAPSILAVCGITASFLVVQRRLKHRIEVLVQKNQELLLAQERTRISRDIHDHLGADLTQITLEAQSAQECFTDPNTAKGCMAQVVNSAQRQSKRLMNSFG